VSGYANAPVPVVCVYADAAGGSHLIELGLPALAHEVDETGKSRFVGVTGATTMGFVVGSGAGVKEWHVAGTAGLSIVLSGEWEIEAGSGARRMLRPGSVLLMLDTHGQGHRAHSYDAAGSTVLGVGIDAATETAFRALLAEALAVVA
jgi:hypothetical protein